MTKLHQDGFAPGWVALMLLVGGAGALAQVPGNEPAGSESRSAASSSAAARPNLGDDFSSLLDGIRQRHDVPGLAVVALRGDTIIAHGASGVRKRGGDAKITIRDKFHLGSCTKAMTATLIAMLVEDGKLQWSTTVGASLPDLASAMDAGWRDVTIEQLLCHRGGAPENLDADGLWGRLLARRGTPTEQRMQLVRGVLKRPPICKPGTEYHYSNAGVAIAGAIAERATGTPWETLMQERLFKPLEMHGAGFGAPGTHGKLDEPLGHTAAGVPVEAGPNADNPPAIGPAGTVHAPLPDWAKFVALHLGGGRGDAKLLPSASFKRLHTPSGQDDDAYAMGWGVAQRPWAGGVALTHAGTNTLWFAVVWIAPAKNYAIVAACNQGGDEAFKACDEAIGAITSQLLGE